MEEQSYFVRRHVTLETVVRPQLPHQDAEGVHQWTL